VHPQCVTGLGLWMGCGQTFDGRPRPRDRRPMRRGAVRIDTAEPFLGSAAVNAGDLTPGELRGPRVRRLFQDVYVAAGVRVSHELICAAAALVLPPSAVLTGRSAATLRGVPLAGPTDPVEAVVPKEVRVYRRFGLRVRRSDLGPAEWEPWRTVGLATPSRTALDLLLDRPLVDAVADLDAVLRFGIVDREELRRMLSGRHDNGIRRARDAEVLADPRAESRPESRIRVLLVLDGLDPVPQHWVCDARGRFARPDLALPELRLAVEYDGAREGDRWALARDRERLNRLYAAGWEVVFVTAAMLREPRALVQAVREASARRRCTVDALRGFGSG
jgi:hypothetical protein